jgi:hypothetical protein
VIPRRPRPSTTPSALIGALATCVLIAMIASPATASARDTYVDGSDGSDASAQCRKASPCATIGRGITKAGQGDVVFVGGDPAEYSEPLELGDRKSIVGSNFSRKRTIDTSGRAVIDTGSVAAIQVISEAGRIKGLTVRSDSRAILLTAPATITGDRFTDPDAPFYVQVTLAAIATKIVDNRFVDPDPASAAQGVNAAIGAVPRIRENEFDDVAEAINVADGFISGNDIAGTPRSGFGIRTIGGSGARLTANRLHSPSLNGAGTARGVFTTVPTQFERNLIRGYDEGVHVLDDPGPVTFDGDAILNSQAIGLTLNDTGVDDPGVGDATATNITLTGSQGVFEGGITAAVFTIDSSIVGDGGLGALNATCVITHSRGPTQTPGGDGCADFQTTANPRLKPDGYHLRASSPMIDRGNPDKPETGAKDIDGDKRALDGPDDGGCRGNARRDIGADEFRCA